MFIVRLTNVKCNQKSLTQNLLTVVHIQYMNLLMFVMPWAYVAPGNPLSLNVQCFIIMNHFMISYDQLTRTKLVQWCPGFMSRLWLPIYFFPLASHNRDVFLFVFCILSEKWFMRLIPLQSSLCSSVLTSPMISRFNVFHRFIMHHSLEPISSNLFLILIFHLFLFKPSATPDCSFPVRYSRFATIWCESVLDLVHASVS